MTLEQIRRLSEDAHERQLDSDGTLHFAHVERVADAVDGDEAIVTALLHDVLEDTSLTADDLREHHIPAHVIAAVELLTRADGTPYEDYIRRIATAEGRAGQLAWLVKSADVQDNLVRSRRQGDHERVQKYERAWRLLHPKVLTIDDESPIRTLYRINLEADGFEVIEANDGRAGLKLAAREQPDLILLDVMMPGPDGWQVAEELRRSAATLEIPFVFATPRRAYRDCIRGLELGAIDYITLPTNPLMIAQRIAGLLAMSAAGRDDHRREKLATVRALMESDPGGDWQN